MSFSYVRPFLAHPRRPFSGSGVFGRNVRQRRNYNYARKSTYSSKKNALVKRTVGKNAHSLGGSDSMRMGRFFGMLHPKQLRMNFGFNQLFALTTDYNFQYNWRGNSINDPDVALGGNSCAGTTAWAYIYDRYKVIASTMIIEAVNNSTGDPLHITCWPSKTGTAPAVGQFDSTFNMPGSKNITVVNGAGRGVLTHHATTASTNAVREVDDMSFGAALTSDPAQQWYWVVCFWNRDTGSNLDAEIRVRIIYDTILYEPNFDSLGTA